MQYDRRQLLGFFAAFAGVHPALGQTAQPTGCAIAPGASASLDLYADSPTTALTARQRERFVNSSGDANFDRALGRVLVNLAGFFNETPGFAFYRDGVDRKNALASPESLGSGTWGRVLFGLDMLRHQLDRPVAGDIAVLAICAHEFAHVKQFHSGVYDQMQATLESYCTELHADYLAGFFLHHYHEQYPAVNLQGAGIAWEDLGAGPFDNPGSHGRSSWRVRSIEGGFFYRRDNPGASIDAAVQAGRRFMEEQRYLG